MQAGLLRSPFLATLRHEHCSRRANAAGMAPGCTSRHVTAAGCRSLPGHALTRAAGSPRTRAHPTPNPHPPCPTPIPLDRPTDGTCHEIGFVVTAVSTEVWTDAQLADDGATLCSARLPDWQYVRTERSGNNNRWKHYCRHCGLPRDSVLMWCVHTPCSACLPSWLCCANLSGTAWLCCSTSLALLGSLPGFAATELRHGPACALTHSTHPRLAAPRPPLCCPLQVWERSVMLRQVSG